jgi:hypothetical protein
VIVLIVMFILLVVLYLLLGFFVFLDTVQIQAQSFPILPSSKGNKIIDIFLFLLYLLNRIFIRELGRLIKGLINRAYITFLLPNLMIEITFKGQNLVLIIEVEEIDWFDDSNRG